MPALTPDTRLEPLHAALVARLRTSGSEVAELPPFDPMARSVEVRPAPGTQGQLSERALLIEVKGHPEATLHPAEAGEQAELRPTPRTRNLGPKRLPRLLDHLCRSCDLDPAGRYCSPTHALRAAVDAMPESEVREVLAQRALWEWLKATRPGYAHLQVQLAPWYGDYAILSRKHRRLPEKEERALVLLWYLEQGRRDRERLQRVQERRSAFRLIAGGKPTPPRSRPRHPDGTGTAA